MNFLASLFSGGNFVEQVGNVVDKVFTSDDERMERENERYRAAREYDYKDNQIIAQQNVAQTEVNKVEAAHASLFVAGWRPAIGWVGAIALFYQFIAYPLLCWLPVDKPPEPLDYTMLYTLITGMLGIAGLRSYDKAKGTDTKRAKRIK